MASRSQEPSVAWMRAKGTSGLARRSVVIGRRLYLRRSVRPWTTIHSLRSVREAGDKMMMKGLDWRYSEVCCMHRQPQSRKGDPPFQAGGYARSLILGTTSRPPRKHADGTRKSLTRSGPQYSVCFSRAIARDVTRWPWSEKDRSADDDARTRRPCLPGRQVTPQNLPPVYSNLLSSSLKAVTS